MSSLAMTRAEREAFLAAVHVGVISLADGERGPLTVPIWYGYEPGGELWIVTDRDSRKPSSHKFRQTARNTGASISGTGGARGVATRDCEPPSHAPRSDVKQFARAGRRRAATHRRP